MALFAIKAKTPGGYDEIGLLELQYKHLGELIAFTREIQKKGAAPMNFDVFDKSEIEKYEEEVKAKWGNTKAYQEYRQKDIALKIRLKTSLKLSCAALLAVLYSTCL